MLLDIKFIKNIKTINGKVRRCASQEGNAIYYSHKLGLTDERTEQLVDRLLEFQWPDGGWNCDKNPEALNSSYHESLIPLRGLNQYQKRKPGNVVKKTIEKATELFLKRKRRPIEIVSEIS